MDLPMIDIPEGAWPLIYLFIAGLAIFMLVLMIGVYEAAMEGKEFFKHMNEERRTTRLTSLLTPDITDRR